MVILLISSPGPSSDARRGILRTRSPTVKSIKVSSLFLQYRGGFRLFFRVTERAYKREEIKKGRVVVLLLNFPSN